MLNMPNSKFVIVGLYIDDFPLISNANTYLTIAKKELVCVFPITNLGPMTHFLGIKVARKRSKGYDHNMNELHIDLLPSYLNFIATSFG